MTAVWVKVNALIGSSGFENVALLSSSVHCARCTGGPCHTVMGRLRAAAAVDCKNSGVWPALVPVVSFPAVPTVSSLDGRRT